MMGSWQLVVCVLLATRSSASYQGQLRSAGAAQEQTLQTTWEQELNDDSLDQGKPTPIQRVLKLLNEMKTQLESEAKADSESYDKMVCWCETNEKEKKKAISDADAKINDLQAEIEGFAAKMGALSTNIAQMKEDITTKQQSLDTATSIREKEHAAFNTEEKEMLEAITMLKNAIEVLSKHQAGLLQMTLPIQESLGAALRWVALKHEEMLEMGADTTATKAAALLQAKGAAMNGVDAGLDDAVFKALRGSKTAAAVEIPPDFASRILSNALKKGTSLVQQSLEPEYFNEKPSHLKAYTPNSGQIFGLLNEMKEEFEVNLSQAQKEELEAATKFAELKAALTKEIEANKASLDDMEEEYAAATKGNADAKEDFEATMATRSEDVKFLSDVRLQCQELDRQWETRSKTRSEELKAVAETIAMLTDDDTRDLFYKKMGTGSAASFLQVDSATRAKQQMARSQAASVLLAASSRLRKQIPDFGDLYKVYHPAEQKPADKLAAVAVQVQLDAFTRVKKAMDDMVADLKEQQQEEVKHKDFCNSGLNENEKESYNNKQDLSDTNDKIQSLEETIQTLDEEIAAAKDQIATIQTETKKASMIRENENKDFQEEVTDQRAMQAILKKAIARLEVVYKQALVQEDPVSPEQFKPYKKNGGGGSVISLLQAIVEDSAKAESEAVASENASQKAYEAFVNDGAATQQKLTEAIASKTDAKGQSSLQLAQAQADAQSFEDKLQELAQMEADLHSQCDFILKNFNIRQQARQQEIEAIQQAKAYLSGMDDE